MGLLKEKKRRERIAKLEEEKNLNLAMLEGVVNDENDEVNFIKEEINIEEEKVEEVLGDEPTYVIPDNVKDYIEFLEKENKALKADNINTLNRIADLNETVNALVEQVKEGQGQNVRGKIKRFSENTYDLKFKPVATHKNGVYDNKLPEGY
jgi:hypothetical protein